MNKWSATSKARLLTATPELQDLFNVVLQRHDCSIIYGARTPEEQRRMVEEGLSKTMDSKHIPQEDGCSHALDVAPFPLDWDNTKQFYYFAGIVIATAIEMGIDIRWGGDWDSDNDLDDQSFMDLVHFEQVS